MSLPRLLLVPAAIFAALSSTILLASGPTFWTVATAADFLKGTSDGVYVTLSGVITAGPQLTNRLTSTPSQIWSLAQAADGTLWAGTGGDGRVIRVRAGQPEETVLDTEETNVFALATTGARVYAATSPDGKVYVIDGTATPRVFFDPEEKYIWALAIDPSGRLWVGAGNPAVLYRVAPDGTSQVVYRPPASHVVSLATDAAGRMMAGTDSPGRLYRFDPADRPFVVLDSGMAELRAISSDQNGVVFAAAVARGDDSAATSSGGETASISIALAPPAPTGRGASSSSPSSAAASSSSTAGPRRSVVYRIDPNGTWEDIWASGDVVYDISAQNDGGVLVATGADGRLYKIDRSLDVYLLTGVDARQVTRFVSGARAAPLSAFATANPGRIVAVGSGVQTPARYVSSVRDTKSVATWGLVRWEATGPVTLSTRSGNTEHPDDSWSEWSAPYEKREGELITSPAGRFLQWRAQFTSQTGVAPAQLTAVTVAYLPRNSRPSISSITIHPPGVVFQRPFVNDDSAIAGLDDATADSRRPPGGDTAATTPTPGRRMFQKGLQTITWKGDDDDNDRLTYALQYRREGEQTWRDLKAGLSDGIFVWDTTTVPDGRYVLRVRASDAPSNAGDRALDGDRESDPVSVDNTPPSVTVETTRQGTSVRLILRVHDGRSPIQKVEYSVGGGAWQMIYPVDGLADSPDERYEISLASETDINLIVIRATDLLLNVISQPAVAR
ncbi:MAG: hypothetical protein ABI051_13880 [Vicinamibacterales bacterium]